MGYINFEDHALIKRQWACKRVTSGKFNNEENKATVKSNLQLFLEVVHIFKVLKFTTT
jgi:hypothetical protein